MRCKPYRFFSDIFSVNNLNSTGPNRASIGRAFNNYSRPLYFGRSGLCGRSLITSSSYDPYTGRLLSNTFLEPLVALVDPDEDSQGTSNLIGCDLGAYTSHTSAGGVL